MATVLVTGMSGAGKSSALAELARRGYEVVETDEGGWCDETVDPVTERVEQRWREALVGALLDRPRDGHLFVSGTVPNQGALYPRFDAVVLLTAPVEVLLERVGARTTNDYGKSAAQRERIREDVAAVEPLLRAGATHELDTRSPLGDVADALEAIARASALRR